jgi:hypothetical protein
MRFFRQENKIENKPLPRKGGEKVANRLSPTLILVLRMNLEVDGLRLGDKPRCLISQVPCGGVPTTYSIDVLST